MIMSARGGLKSQNYIFSGSNRIEDVAWCLNNSSGNGAKTFTMNIEMR